MNSADEIRLIELLNERHNWPSIFLFKFIVPDGKGKDLEALIPEAEKREVRPSSGGKYLAYTFHCAMGSAREVLEVYSRVRAIEGLISL